MSVDETGISPTERSIHILPVGEIIGDQTTTITTTQTAIDDGHVKVRAGGWNRVAPQWLDNSRLVYAAKAPDTRSTIFILDLSTGIEHDVGGDIQVVDSRYRYTAFGAPIVSPDGRAIAVTAHRADEPGADMLLLDATGKEQDMVQDGYWTRPLAWSDDQSLFYLVTACDSTLIQDYALYMRDSSGKKTLLAAGKSLGTIGEVVAVGDGLAYVTASRVLPGVRGPERASPYSPSAIWYWSFTEQSRGVVYEARYGITQLAR
jgi:Tol biopolymer transport system component